MCVCDLKSRLACAGDYTAEHIFMSAECALFRYRLQSLDEVRVKCFVRQFHRLRRYFLKSTEMLCASVELTEVRELLSVLDDCSIDWKSIIAGYTSCALERHGNEHTRFPDNCHIAVPFRFVQSLVAQRKVLLSNGMALLVPSQLPHVLATVFREWLKYGILLARMREPHVTSGDDRFKLLFRECRVNIFLVHHYLLRLKYLCSCKIFTISVCLFVYFIKTASLLILEVHRLKVVKMVWASFYRMSPY